jgi:hypothetical protein
MSVSLVKASTPAVFTYGVAYLMLDLERVSVWDNGTNLESVTMVGHAADADRQVIADRVLRDLGWLRTSDWTRPTNEWTEFRCEAIKMSAPHGWRTVTA